jgi:hypothetical protein
MQEATARKPLYQIVLESSVIATCVAGLLTTVVGGYLLDLAKTNSRELQREREKQAALIENQLDVLESLNSVLAESSSIVRARRSKTGRRSLRASRPMTRLPARFWPALIAMCSVFVFISPTRISATSWRLTSPATLSAIT